MFTPHRRLLERTADALNWASDKTLAVPVHRASVSTVPSLARRHDVRGCERIALELTADLGDVGIDGTRQNSRRISPRPRAEIKAARSVWTSIPRRSPRCRKTRPRSAWATTRPGWSRLMIRPFPRLRLMSSSKQYLPSHRESGGVFHEGSIGPQARRPAGDCRFHGSRRRRRNAWACGRQAHGDRTHGRRLSSCADTYLSRAPVLSRVRRSIETTSGVVLTLFVNFGSRFTLFVKRPPEFALVVKTTPEVVYALGRRSGPWHHESTPRHDPDTPD